MRRSCALLVVLLVPASANAHPDVDRGLALAQEASFEEAMAAFDAAERSTLSHAELVQLLEGRALVHQGLGATADRDRTLEMLLTIAPEHTMGRRMPPALRRALDAAKAGATGVVSLSVHTAQMTGGVSIEARVDGDAHGLVRTVRTHSRPPGGQWTTADGRSVTIPIAGGAAVELWVEALGPGGAPVASHASAEAPERFVSTEPVAVEPVLAPAATQQPPPARAPGVVSLEPGTPPAERADEDAGGSVLPWIVAGGLLVAVAVVVAVVLIVPGDDTQPSVPTTPFP